MLLSNVLMLQQRARRPQESHMSRSFYCRDENAQCFAITFDTTCAYEGDCHCSGFLSTRTSKLNMRLVQRVHDAVQEFYLARHCYNSTGAVETAATRQHHSSVAANSSFLLPRRLIYKSKTAEQQLNPHQNWRPGIAFADQNKLHYSEIMTGEGAFDGQ